MYAEENVYLWGRIIDKTNYTKRMVYIPVLLLPVLHHQSMRFMVRRNNSLGEEKKKRNQKKKISNCKEKKQSTQTPFSRALPEFNSCYNSSLQKCRTQHCSSFINLIKEYREKTLKNWKPMDQQNTLVLDL